MSMYIYVKAQDKPNFSAKNCEYFFHSSVLKVRKKAKILGAQKNRLKEMVLLSTHNICYGGEIRKKNTHSYLRGLIGK